MRALLRFRMRLVLSGSARQRIASLCQKTGATPSQVVDALVMACPVDPEIVLERQARRRTLEDLWGG